MADPSPPPPTESTVVDTTDDEKSALSTAEFLTRYEVLKRRSQRMKRLKKLYKSHYWALMEELRGKYREYYWVYGKSPYKDDNNNNKINNNFGDGNNSKNTNNNEEKKDIEEGVFVKKCGMAGCKARAMAMTSFCHPHILSDSKQKLYKGCSYVIKSGQTGPILCGKPILRSTIPSLCHNHFQKAEKHVARALKKAGLNVTSPSKVAPKLHVVVAEYVRQIQTKRRAAQKIFDLHRVSGVVDLDFNLGSTDCSESLELGHWTYALQDNSLCIISCCISCIFSHHKILVGSTDCGFGDLC